MSTGAHARATPRARRWDHPRPKEPALHPDTYARLYGPARPTPSRRGTGIAVVAALLWAVALLLLSGAGFLALWAGATDGIPLIWAPTGLAVAGVPVTLLRTPAVRRLTVPARALVTGLAMCAITLGLVIWAA